MESILYLEESLKLNIFDMSLDPYEHFMFEMTEAEEDLEIIKESEGATKKNIFQRIKEIAKKIWRWIVNKVNIATLWIRNVFGLIGDNSSGDINDIAGTVVDTTLSDIAKDVAEGREVAKRMLSTHYESGNLIKFNILKNSFNNAFNNSEDSYHHARRPSECISILFRCINNPAMLNELLVFMEDVVNKRDVNRRFETVKKMVDTAIAKVTDAGDHGSYVTTMDEWIVFNEKVIKLGKLMETWDDFSIDIMQNGQYMTQQWVDLFNTIAQFSSFLNYGLNIVSDSMKHSYDLSSEYYNTIGDIEPLSKFVKGCIESSVPGKYLHKAIRQISTVKINCKKDDPNTKNLSWGTLPGQGRFIMFPQNQDEIIKIEYTQYGIRSNVVEDNVYNFAKDHPKILERLCAIRQMSENKVIMVTDRAQVEEIERSEANKVRDEINKDLADVNAPFMIVDLNNHGFGTVNGKRVIIDYGQIRRRLK